MASKSLGTLTLDIVAQTGGFVQGMDKAERKSKKWRKEVSGNLKATSKQLERGLKVSAAAAAGAIAGLTAATVKLTREGLASVDAQAKLARSLDTSFDSVTALQMAFEEGGIDGFERSINRLNRRLGAAEMGTGEYAKTVEALGLNLKELSSLEADERIARIADAIVDSGVSAQRAARYVQDLGFEQKEAVQFFLQGGDAIRAYREEVDQLGLGLTELDTTKVEQANDAFEKATRILDVVSQQLAVQVAPVLTAVSELFIQNAKDAGGVGEATADAFNVFIEGAAKALNALEKLDRGLLSTQAAADIFAVNVRIGLLEVAREIVEIPTAAVNEMINVINNIPGIDVENLGLSTFGRKIQNTIDESREEIEGLNEALREELSKPLPGDQFQRFVFEAREAAEESARVAADVNRNISSALGTDTGGTDEDLENKLKERVDAIRQSFETERETVKRIQRETAEEIKDLYRQEAISKEEADLLKIESEQRMFEELRELREQSLEENQGYWDQWLESAEENLQSFDDLSKTVIDNFTTGFGNAFESIIFDAQSLDDALKGVAETILRSVVNAIGQMAAQWIALQAVQAITGSTATAATVAQAATASAAWAPAAASASLATLGTNAAPAAAALVSTNALSKSLSLAGMAHDGMDSVPKDGTWLLEKGERVTTAETSAKLDATLDQVAKGGGGGGGRVDQTLVFQISGDVTDRTRTEIMKAMPLIREQAKQAVIGASSQGGSMSRAMGRRP